MPAVDFKSARVSQGSKSAARPNVIVGLQYARGLAALIVAVTHAIVHPFLTGPGSSPDLPHLTARFGVTLFFVISGFIMVLTTGQGRFDPVLFMRRRITRVVPLYYVATAIVIVLLLIMPAAFKTTVFDLVHIIKSLLFIPAFEPTGSGAIHPTLRLGWTLQYEMFFYLAFALCWTLGLRQRAVALTLFFGGLILIGQFVDFKNAIFVAYVQLDTLAFVAGVWLAVFVGGQRVSMRTSAAKIILGLVIGSAVVMALLYGEIRNSQWTQFWLVLFCVAVVWLLLSQRSEPRSLFGRFMLAAGNASYSIYLFHMFAVGGMTYIALRLLPAALLPIMIVLTAVAAVTIGFVAYRFVEIPLNRAFHRRQLAKAKV